MENNSVNLQALFGNAAGAGDVDPNAANLAITIAKGNPKISNLGVDVSDINDAEVVSFHLLVDDSGSIETEGNTQNVCDGEKIFLDTLMGAKKRANILVAVDCLNDDGNIELPYTLLVDGNDSLQIPYLNSGNYNPRGGTPLYRRVAEAATTMLAKIQQIRQNGQQERSFLVIVTDGEDLHSHGTTAADVKRLVDEILKSETNGVYAIGLSNPRVNFRRIFAEMGIPDANVWTPDAMDPKEIRRAFQTMSQSASGAATSGTTTGGFGN